MNREVIASAGVDAGLESSVSAVAWPAVFAGTLVAVAASLALLVLGSALGLASVSPWSISPETAATAGLWAAVWLVAMQWIASALGGYFTGRLRTKWVGIHSDEVLFRDTAHGFLTWAFATVLVAGLFASTAASVVGTGVQAASTVASGAAQGAGAAAGSLAGAMDPMAYFVDRLFRPETAPADATEAAAPAAPATTAAPDTTAAPAPAPGTPAPAPGTPAAPSSPASAPAAPTATPAVAPAAGGDVGTLTPELRDEVGRLLTRNLAAADFDEGDRTYLIDVVARVSGVDTDAAAARVDEMVAMASAAAQQATEAADATRQAGAAASIAFFLSLLVGAFVACVAAVLGGRERDEVRLVATA